MRPRSSVAFWMVLLQLAAGASRAPAEEISASRYRLRVTASGLTTQREPLDHAVFLSFCKDDDGCEAVLVNDNGGDRLIARTRLILSVSNTNFWSIETSTDDFVDGGVVETVVSKTSDGTCRFSDEDVGGGDNGVGFTLAAEAASDPISCILTLVD